MGVQLNIKDAETVRMARDLANSSGRSVTEVIRTAIDREWREREATVQAKIDDVRKITAEFRANMPPEWHGKTSKEIMDSIYNEDGSFAE